MVLLNGHRPPCQKGRIPPRLRRQADVGHRHLTAGEGLLITSAPGRPERSHRMNGGQGILIWKEREKQAISTNTHLGLLRNCHCKRRQVPNN